MDKVRNEEGERRVAIEREFVSRVDQRVLRRLEEMDKKDEYCMARKVLLAEVDAGYVVD